MFKKVIVDDDYEDILMNEKNDKKNSKKNSKNDIKSVITLTFGDMAENHVGMEKLGKMVDIGEGFQYEDFVTIKNKLEEMGGKVEIINIGKEAGVFCDAYILVMRNALNILTGDSNYHMKMFLEQSKLDVDKKAFMYGRVVNKNARWNLCFDEKGQEPDYENGKGRVISFCDIPLTKKIVDSFSQYFGDKCKDLKGEGNYYYDISKCGIGFHGDSERRKVLAIRLGESMDIHYQWFKEGLAVGKRVIVPLDGGDMYMMCEKAVGTDWKKKKIYTVRHATGSSKFLK
jgi:hypothetical protein